MRLAVAASRCADRQGAANWSMSRSKLYGHCQMWRDFCRNPDHNRLKLGHLVYHVRCVVHIAYYVGAAIWAELNAFVRRAQDQVLNPMIAAPPPRWPAEQGDESARLLSWLGTDGESDATLEGALLMTLRFVAGERRHRCYYTLSRPVLLGAASNRRGLQSSRHRA